MDCLPLWLLVILLVALLCASTAPAAPPAPKAFCYVAPDGNDRWSGKLAKPNPGKTDGPVATIGAAQARVRAALAAGPAGPLTVLIRGGVYQLPTPLTFSGQDSGSEKTPVTYAAYPGEAPVLSGGTPLGKWRQGEGKLWVCDVPEVRAGNWYFHQLFVGGQRRTRARTPNSGEYYNIAGALDPTVNRSEARSDPKTKLGFRFKPGEILPSAEPEDVNVVVYHAWTASRHWIKELDGKESLVRFRAPSGWPIGYWDAHARYYVENLKEALDSPGEWYLSRKEGKLYYWPLPGEKMAQARAVAPRLQHLLELQGDPALGLPVSHLTFRGLSFRHADWVHDPDKICDGQADIHLSAAVVATGARNCTFDNCEIAHVGEYALILDHGCKHNKVVHCEIHDLGGGGVRIGNTDLPSDAERQADHNTVDNCFIHDGGHVFPAGIGVWIGRSSYNNVTHNEISDLYYSGCSVGWSWGYAASTANHNLFEYNHIHHIGQGMLSDMGGIYSLGISPGTVERLNHIHDVYSYSYGGWGLYTDEGSADMVLENNFVHNTKTGGFHQHYGQRNLIRNNLFVRSMEANIISQRIDLPNDLTFERNIVVTDNGQPLGGNLTPDRFTLRNNLYWDVAGNELDFYGQTFAQWQAKGKDEGSLIAAPFLKGREDLNFAGDSPLHRIGFVPFDLKPCGLYGDKAWVDKPKSIVHAEVKLPPPPGPKLVNDDFEQTPVGAQPDADTVSEEEPATIRISDEAAASGTHSLKFTDAPGLKHDWQPHMYYRPRIRQGVVRVSFAVRLEQGAILWHEWRDANNPYRVGPSLRISANGEVVVGGKTLTQVPRSTWLALQITCGVGKDSTGEWALQLTVPGQAPQKFEHLPNGMQAFRTLDWLGFISLANEKVVWYLDDLKMKVSE